MLSANSHCEARPLAHAIAAFAIVICCMLISACGGSSESAPPAIVTPDPEPQPKPQPEPQPEPEPEPEPADDTRPKPDPAYGDLPPVEPLTRLHTHGVNWVNQQGEVVNLRGANLGNWLLQEFWMTEQQYSDAVHDQCSLEKELTQRFGEAEKDRLLDIFHDSWISDRDWVQMREFGLNLVRIPFIHSLIEDDSNPYNLRSDAWQYLDYAVEQASAQGMYVILDLHGAAGAQGWQDHSGCANRNEYWGNEDYKARTRWLWQQIATRYKDNPAIAGFNLLNEPWGAEPGQMAEEIIKIYDAVREVDPETIIILNGHYSGIDAYGNPHHKGMTNVAFDMHFYPGIFGWGEIGYEVHRDWLTCGADGHSGVCGWADKMESIQSPLLVGEFQPWTGMGDIHGENTRVTYDIFNQLGWAASSWSYKTVSKAGGHGGWGMVSNKGDQLLAKADTWACAGWDSTMSEACASSLDSVSVEGDGPQERYLVIKAGACCDGNLDVAIDRLRLVNDSTGENALVNGDFGDDSGWTQWFFNAQPDLDFTYDGSNTPTGSDGPVLRLSSTGEVNGGVYQKVILQPGQSYSFSGVFKDLGSASGWAEIYLVPEQPVNGNDVLGEAMTPIDFSTASIQEIEEYYEQFATQPYSIDQNLLAWMRTEQPTTLYTLPDAPVGLSIEESEAGRTLSWVTNSEEDVTGYNVYRSTHAGDQGTLIGNTDSNSYLDDADLPGGTLYFYRVTAIDLDDESYPSNAVSVESGARVLPGQIEAESYDAMFGIQVESTSDVGGGANIGYIDAGDWVEYEVEVETAGTYAVEYRVASEQAAGAFELVMGGEVVDTQTVASTSGWQNWVTIESPVELQAGKQVMRLNFTNGPFNLNWVRFSKK